MRSVEDCDRAIPAGINTWVNLESYPVSCFWLPLPIRMMLNVDDSSARIACHRLQTHAYDEACVYEIASARAPNEREAPMLNGYVIGVRLASYSMCEAAGIGPQA